MGYTVEVSYNMEKCDNITETYKLIARQANECHADSHYEQYELSGNVKQPRHHCVMIVTFSEEHLLHCSRFIRQMKQMKHIYVECIYDDAIRCNLLYASPYYIQNMEKHCAADYKKRRNERSMSLSEGEELLVNSMSRRKPRANTLDHVPVTASLLTGPAGPAGPAGPTGPTRPTST